MGDDYISGLPDDILCLILSLLTIRESVKARLVSLRWRYLFPHISHLELNLSTMFGIPKSWSWDTNFNNHKQYKSKFIKAVDQFMHSWSHIRKIISFKVLFCYEDEISDDIDRWVRFSLMMGTQKIHLSFGYCLKPDKPYNFPCHLLTSSLNHLCLESCCLSPSPEFASRLNSLKSLELSCVSLGESDAQNIVSGCLNLESLIFRHCTLPRTLCIHGKLLSLKSLVVEICLDTSKIDINSIPLQTLEYMGARADFTFVSVPLLKKVKLWFLRPFDVGGHYMFNGLVKDLPQLESLSLYYCAERASPLPVRMASFTCLKELHMLIVTSWNFDLLTITHLINASPILQRINLNLRYGSGTSARRQKTECFNCVHLHLTEVVITGFRDECNGVELAAYLLNNAVALERMTLTPYKSLDDDGLHKVYGWHDSEFKQQKVYDFLSNHKLNPRVELIVL